MRSTTGKVYHYAWWRIVSCWNMLLCYLYCKTMLEQFTKVQRMGKTLYWAPQVFSWFLCSVPYRNKISCFSHIYQPVNTSTHSHTSLKSKSSLAFSRITLFSRGVSVSCPPRGKLSSSSSSMVALQIEENEGEEGASVHYNRPQKLSNYVHLPQPKSYNL